VVGQALAFVVKFHIDAAGCVKFERRHGNVLQAAGRRTNCEKHKKMFIALRGD
jgi:hypothetical protein